MKVCVIGAGVIGLSTAFNILQQSPEVEVTIVAERFSPNTTSDQVAGFWEPFKFGNTPVDVVMKLAVPTFNHYLSLLRSGDASRVGIELVSGYYFVPEHTFSPAWKDVVFGFRNVTEREIKEFAPHARGGAFFTTMLYNGKKYLPMLMEKILERKGTIAKKKVGNLEEFADDFDVVVNCAGMGARGLVGDDTLIPYQGQLLTVKGVHQKLFWVDCCGTHNTSVFPRNGEIIIGGNVTSGKWSTTPSMVMQDDILRRARRLVPSLKDAIVINSWAGLRPYRPEGVRLELETMTFGTKRLHVVHNYGHGGAGVTLHWGCAQEAARLVMSCQKNHIASKL